MYCEFQTGQIRKNGNIPLKDGRVFHNFNRKNTVNLHTELPRMKVKSLMSLVVNNLQVLVTLIKAS